MELLEVGRISLNIRRSGPALAAGAGSAAVVVCIHGLVLDSLASLFLTLAGPLGKAGTASVMYDLRGHGLSGRPVSGYRLRDHVGDLIGILDALGLNEPVHLVGNSFGGTIALAAAATAPDRVASVVSVEGFPPTDPWAGRIRDLMEDGLARLTQGDFAAPSLGTPQRSAVRAVDRMRDLWTNTAIVNEVPERPWLPPDDVGSVTCPVLGIFGSRSPFAVDSARSLKALLPAVQCAVVADYDHFLLVKARQVVSRQIVGWLADIDPRISPRPEVRRYGQRPNDDLVVGEADQ